MNKAQRPYKRQYEELMRLYMDLHHSADLLQLYEQIDVSKNIREQATKVREAALIALDNFVALRAYPQALV